ncbi:LPS assembly lipoprotein LptE [Psychrobium sp. nBUS_13]|uniref:LPS-assembly lipoprotein LptE n=1 Tax=Psychrobium sp. nBUS_13 TaxID=3395319 RepID=UPI003EBF6F05
MHPINNFTKVCVITTILFIISGCGFRLQGHYPLPTSLQSLNVQSQDKFNEITRLVTTQLSQQKVQLNTNSTSPVLRLGKEKFERGTLSLFSTGQVAEYELIYSLDYQLIEPNKEPKLFNVTIRRDYLDDPQTAQAKSREREQLLREIRQQASRQIIQQLSRL